MTNEARGIWPSVYETPILADELPRDSVPETALRAVYDDDLRRVAIYQEDDCIAIPVELFGRFWREVEAFIDRSRIAERGRS